MSKFTCTLSQGHQTGAYAGLLLGLWNINIHVNTHVTISKPPKFHFSPRRLLGSDSKIPKDKDDEQQGQYKQLAFS